MMLVVTSSGAMAARGEADGSTGEDQLTEGLTVSSVRR